MNFHRMFLTSSDQDALVVLELDESTGGVPPRLVPGGEGGEAGGGGVQGIAGGEGGGGGAVRALPAW